MIVPIVPVASNNVQTTETTIWEHCQDDLKRPRRLRRPRSLERNWVLSRRSGRSSKFWSDHMKTLSAVHWEDDLNDLRLGRFPRNQQSYSSYREKNRPGRRWGRKKNLKQKCSHRVWALFEKKSPFHQVLDVTSLCLRGILLARLRRKIERKSGPRARHESPGPQSLSLKSRFLFPFSISYECFV